MRELLVRHVEERRAGEPRQRREAELGVDAVLIHVLDALIDVVATGAHLVEAHRLEADLLLGLAGDGVQPDGGVPGAVDLPHLLGAGVDVAERVDGLAGDLDDPRAPVAELGREAPLEGITVLDDVVVDRTDLDVGRQRHTTQSTG